MNRTSLLLAAALVFACTARAQFFMELHGSYLLPIGGYGQQSSTETKISSELLNFGRGTGGGMVFGASLSQALGLEARITYVSGTEQQFKNTYGSTYSASNSTDTWKTHYVRFEPAVRFTAGAGAFKGYVAVGPSIAFAPTSTSDDTYVSAYYSPWNSYTRTNVRTHEYTGGMGWGGFGALGFTWSGGGAFGLFAEVQGVAQNWAPKEDAYTSAETTVEGNNVSYVTESENIQFENSYDVEDEGKAVKLHLPMSIWGVRAGVRITYGGS